MDIKIFINGIEKPDIASRIISISFRANIDLDEPETVLITLEDKDRLLKIPEIKTTKIELEIEGVRTNAYFYNGSSWRFPTGTLEIQGLGIDMISLKNEKLSDDLDLMNVPLQKALKELMGKTEVMIDENIKNQRISIITEGKNRGTILQELAKNFNITPICRDGKVLFYLDNSPQRKRFQMTPDDLTKIFWTDMESKTPSGIAVPYTESEYLQTVYYIAGDKTAPLKISDMQATKEDAKRLAESLFSKAKSNKYQIAFTLTHANLKLKVGSIAQIQGVKNTIDNDYLITNVETNVENNSAPETRVKGRLLIN